MIEYNSIQFFTDKLTIRAIFIGRSSKNDTFL